jgi:hypothetical protein
MGLTPRITVLMPCHNMERWVGEAITSVLTQTHAELELLIVENGSNDASRRVIDQFAKEDRRIKRIYQDADIGVSAARNLGLDAASGAYISMLDADDRMKPATLERQLACFSEAQHRRKSVQLVCSDAATINEAGRPISRYMPAAWWGVVLDENAPFFTLPSTWFMERSCPARFPPEWRVGEAGPFMHQVVDAGGMSYYGEPLVDYRLRMSSATSAQARACLRAMAATGETLAAGRSWDHPIRPSEVDDPRWSEVIAWKYGRIAKAASANDHLLLATGAALLVAAAAPRLAFAKLRTECVRRIFAGGHGAPTADTSLTAR